MYRAETLKASYSSLDSSQNTPEKPSCQERAESLTSRDGRNTEQREEALRTYSSESRQLLKLSGTTPTHMEDPDRQIGLHLLAVCAISSCCLFRPHTGAYETGSALRWTHLPTLSPPSKLINTESAGALQSWQHRACLMPLPGTQPCTWFRVGQREDLQGQRR